MRPSSQLLPTSRSPRPPTRLRTLGALLRALFLLAGVLMLSSVLLAQNKQYTKNTPDQTMRSDARVDSASHALSIQIPLGAYAGRADLNVPISITYSSKFRHLDLDRDFLALQRPSV